MCAGECAVMRDAYCGCKCATYCVVQVQETVGGQSSLCPCTHLGKSRLLALPRKHGPRTAKVSAPSVPLLAKGSGTVLPAACTVVTGGWLSCHGLPKHRVGSAGLALDYRTAFRAWALTAGSAVAATS